MAKINNVEMDEISSTLQSIQAAKSMDDLTSLNPAIRAVFNNVSPDQQKVIIENYNAIADQLRGRCKLADLEGTTIEIARVRNVETEFGESLIISGLKENGQEFECFAGARAFMIFFSKPENLKRLPIKLFIQKVAFGNEGRSSWQINKVGDKVSVNSQAPIPF